MTPPWNDMPPSHSFRISIGCRRYSAEIVEQDIADAAAEDDPERGVKDEVVSVAAGERRARLLQQFQQVPIADENAGEVGKAVPAQVERPDVQRHRRQTEIRERDELRVVSGLQGLPPE